MPDLPLTRRAALLSPALLVFPGLLVPARAENLLSFETAPPGTEAGCTLQEALKAKAAGDDTFFEVLGQLERQLSAAQERLEGSLGGYPPEPFPTPPRLQGAILQTGRVALGDSWPEGIDAITSPRDYARVMERLLFRAASIVGVLRKQRTLPETALEQLLLAFSAMTMLNTSVLGVGEA